eukprot:1646793-Amphidinium_carterae.1
MSTQDFVHSHSQAGMYRRRCALRGGPNHGGCCGRAHGYGERATAAGKAGVTTARNFGTEGKQAVLVGIRSGKAADSPEADCSLGHLVHLVGSMLTPVAADNPGSFLTRDEMQQIRAWSSGSRLLAG